MSEFLEVNFDTRELDRAVKLRLQFPGRTEAQIVNTAAFWIAANAKQRTPSVPQARIDTELNVMVTPRLGKRGQPLSLKSYKNRILVSKAGGASRTAGVSLGVLIFQASRSADSNYNARTHGRFSRVGMKFSRSEMKMAISRMIKTRHSATSFLKSGWVRAVKALRPFAVNKFRRGGLPPLEGQRDDHGRVERGSATPALEGAWQVTAMIENATGMAGSVNAANYNQALIQHGAPALQEAIDIETGLMLEYAEKKMAEENALAFAKCVA
jgi:hypothetical protein